MSASAGAASSSVPRAVRIVARRSAAKSRRSTATTSPSKSSAATSTPSTPPQRASTRCSRSSSRSCGSGSSTVGTRARRDTRTARLRACLVGQRTDDVGDEEQQTRLQAVALEQRHGQRPTSTPPPPSSGLDGRQRALPVDELVALAKQLRRSKVVFHFPPYDGSAAAKRSRLEDSDRPAAVVSRVYDCRRPARSPEQKTVAIR